MGFVFRFVINLEPPDARAAPDRRCVVAVDGAWRHGKPLGRAVAVGDVWCARLRHTQFSATSQDRTVCSKHLREISVRFTSPLAVVRWSSS